ncbi:lysophospholipid acyltransferase family protein [Basilea psittacipulmonis]|uniref:Acyltransferase n=1 Tax=Basilea psittacipulmonis DSM 24701 TaxID=1072685 RepID=A0A077DHV9_9BURK|nr:lysophospholipid acyltransferase family protein [Basilea psittacipulmonis]AIL32718.1 acyltransferase [Basilea psittacipulmonis DSM 24701]
MKKFLLTFLFKFLAILPTRIRLLIGASITLASPLFFKKRIEVVEKNLSLCFPELSETQRHQLCQQHIRALFQSFIDRSVLWYGSTQRIQEMVETQGEHYLHDAIAKGDSILLLAPHFTGLDAAATRLTMNVKESATMYAPQKDLVFDEIIRHGRARFNTVHLCSRHEGIRPILTYLKKGGIPVYYLPDMSFSKKDSIFVPFFGIDTATLPSTAILAKRFNTTVLPILTFWNPKTGKYLVKVLPAMQNFPGDQDIASATAELNLILENWIRDNPSQYYWVHKRFKTRPEGAPNLYE